MEIQFVVPLLAAVIYVSLLLALVANRVWERQHRLFAMYLAAATLWSLSTFFLRSGYLVDYELLVFRIVILSSVLWIVQLYNFIKSLLNQPADLWLWVGYSSLAVFTVLAFLGYWPLGLTFSNGTIEPEWGWFVIPYAVTIEAFAVLGFFMVVKRFRILTEPTERNKYSYLIIAMSLLTFFGFAGLTPLADKFPISHLGALLSACILAYAITRHELVSIDTVLRQAMAWVSLFIVGVGAYLFVFYTLYLLFGFKIEIVTLLITTLVAAAAAVFVYRLRPVFFGVVNQLLSRGTYTYRQALLGFNIRMGSIINLSELADEMLPTIAKALRINHVKLLLEDHDSGDYTPQYSYSTMASSAKHQPILVPDHPLIAWLKRENVPLDMKRIDSIPQLKGLWQTEKDELADLNLDILCPIKSRGTLIGILALGGKAPDAAYSQEDNELLLSLANGAGIIIENARMLESLKTEQFRVKQLLAQVSHAQEEERRRISADLHDSVAQWLAAASYRAQTVSALLVRSGNDKAREELDAMESTIDKSLKELRRVVIALRPPALEELGLNHAVRQSLEDLHADGLECKFNRTGEFVRLPLAVEIAVYRVVQEAINNIRKHAKATKASLNLKYKANELQVEIRDDGRGFDLSETMDSAISAGHMGLLGMRERVESLGGDIKIRSAQGGGTTVVLRFPIQSSLGGE